MKIRNIITIALAGSLAMAACTKEMATDSFEDIKLSSTFVSIPVSGGSQEVTVTSTADWKFIVDENFPEVITFNKKDGNTIKAKHDYYGNFTNEESDIKSRKASWLTASVLEGKAGVTTVKFTAEANDAGREITIAILCGTHKQYLTFRQGEMEPTVASCQDLLEGKYPQGKTIILEGVCSDIYNTTYGNWHLNDGTGDITIYGTLDKDGKTANFASLGIEAGDKVKVQGPFSIYNRTYELSNVTVLKITKSLLKIESESQKVAKAGGKLEVKISYKGSSLLPSVPEEYQDWVSITGMKTIEGKVTKIETNPADTAVVYLKVAANEGEPREASVDFTSSTSSASYIFSQDGVLLAATVAELTAQITGTSSSSSSSYTVKFADNAPAVVSYVNGKNVFIEDSTGGILYYKSSDDKTDYKAGQKITGKITGSGYKFSGLPEITSLDGATITDGTDVPCTEITIAELLKNYERYISCRVLLKNVTVTDAIATTDRDGKIKQGESEIAVRAQSRTLNLAANQTGDFITFPAVYNTTKQLYLYNEDQFTPAN